MGYSRNFKSRDDNFNSKKFQSEIHENPGYFWIGIDFLIDVVFWDIPGFSRFGKI